MPIDASIYQGVLSPLQLQNQVYRNQLQQLQLQQAMRAGQAQNALAQLFQPAQAPGNLPGMQTPPPAQGPGYNPAVMQRIMQLDPALGLKLQQMMQQRQLQQVTMMKDLAGARASDQRVVAQRQQELTQLVLPIKQMALAAYERTLEQSGDPSQALKAGQDAYAKGLTELPNGQLSPDQVRQLRGWTFNPDLARAQVYGSHFTPPTPHLQITGPDTERQVVTDPTTGETRPVSPEVPRFRPTGSGTAPQGPEATPTKGWQFYQDPDTHTMYRLNANAGLSQKLTNTGWVDSPDIDPTKLKRMGGQGQGFGSSLNQRFVNRVAGAANEGVAALVSIAGMKKPNSGLFSMAATGGAGGKNPVKAFLTPDSIKMYNAAMAGLAPEIATAQNQGMVPSEAQIAHVEAAITIGPTDDLKVQQYRVALAARYLRKALEVSTTIATPDQKSKIDSILKQLQRFPDPNAIEDGSWQQGMFGKRTPPTQRGKGAQAPAAPKGLVPPQLLQQYAAQHGLTPQAAAAFLKEQGYDVQGQ